MKKTPQKTKRLSKTISLLTDFGATDAYVGMLKGVIKSISPDSDIVDLCHCVAFHDIKAAAFQLRISYAYFPQGTVHCVVVDPGVGSSRSSIVIRMDGYYFVGPDNGVFTYLYGVAEKKEIRYIENKKFFLKTPSTTFHGRDVFAPVSAYLSSANIFCRLGPECIEPVTFNLAPLERTQTRISGAVIYIDTFGNLITNIPVAWVSSRKIYTVKIKNHRIHGFSRSYGSVPIGSLLAVKGSSGFVEIACHQRSAQKYLNAEYGQPLTISMQ
jgi:S-adenosyl-L-methionine hydrolase (adenosine-forming)